MSIESPLKSSENDRSRTELEERIDTLLLRLPKELQERLEGEIDHLPLEEQVARLEKVIRFRMDDRHTNGSETEESTLLPEGIELYESFPDDAKEMVEKIRTSEQRIEVGYGKAAHVIATPSQPTICYKVLFDDEVLPLATNDIAKETKLQYEIGKKLNNVAGVRIPQVFAFIREQGVRAITMELLDAPSLRRVVERHAESMPKNFNEEKFFTALRTFLKEFHAQGYRHRDFHAGNILVDRKTGMPCVIDFGLSKENVAEESGAYREQIMDNGHFKEIVLQSDEESLELLQLQVRRYLTGTGAV